MCYGFDLGEVEGFHLLLAHYNPKCVPPWPEPELRRKCAEADTRPYEKPRGWLLDEGDDWRPLSPVRPGEAAAALGNLGATQAQPAPPAAAPNPLAGRDEPAADPPPIEAPSAPAAAEHSPSGRGSPVIANYHEAAGADGNQARAVPLSPRQIAGDILRLSGGWPKIAGGRPFVRGRDGSPCYLDDTTSFFGWLNGLAGDAGGFVRWGRGSEHVAKGEFLNWFCESSQAERYDGVEAYPHEPPIPNVYYLHDPLPPCGSGAFDDLLNLFAPATATDRNLMRAMFLTAVWGGPAGKRPIFIIESAAVAEGRAGQGAGKSTVAEAVGQLVGGFVSVSLATTEEKDIQTRLLSEEGRSKRVVIFDNVKGSKVSSSLVESFVTTRTISGRQLYTGEGSRPNYVTWIITANGPSMSKDFASRSYVIRIDTPTYSPDWSDRLESLITGRRVEILADMLAAIRGPEWPDLEGVDWSRWPGWERHVLVRVCDPRAVLAETRDRRDCLDSEADAAAIVRDHLAEFVRRQIIRGDPETLHVSLTSAEMALALGDICPHGKSVIAVGRWLSGVTIRGLSRKRTQDARLWVWKGDKAGHEELRPLTAPPPPPTEEY